MVEKWAETRMKEKVKAGVTFQMRGGRIWVYFCITLKVGYLLLIIVILLMRTRYEQEIQKVQNGLKDNFQRRYKYKNSHSLPLTKEKPSPSKLPHSGSKDIPNDHPHSPISPKKSPQNGHHLDQLDSTLQQLNFSHHENSCLCNDCSCGRHLCKLHVIKPDLRKATVYQTLFNMKKSQQLVVVKPEDTSPLKAAHLDLSSIYLKDYNQSQPEKLERPKPQDQLKFDGPAPTLTTYGSLFPGHRGKNQYVKPTNKHIRGELPFLAKTVYSIEYVPRQKAKSDYQKLHDSLRTGSNWFGASTYEKFFQQPNPESYPAKAVNVEKFIKKPDFSHQFETNYKNEFVEKPSPLCPSKMHLESRSLSGAHNSKHLFRENSDFKSMSPEFKAISTSKHFYV